MFHSLHFEQHFVNVSSLQLHELLVRDLVEAWNLLLRFMLGLAFGLSVGAVCGGGC